MMLEIIFFDGLPLKNPPVMLNFFSVFLSPLALRVRGVRA